MIHSGAGIEATTALETDNDGGAVEDIGRFVTLNGGEFHLLTR